MNSKSPIVSFLVGVLGNIVTEFLGVSQLINPVDTGVLSNIWVQRTIITTSIALFVYLLLNYIVNRKQRFREKNSPRSFVRRSEPKQVYAEGEIQDFGVKWRGKYGTFRKRSYTSDEPYVYVEGPFCPDDDYELKSRTVPKWFIFEQEAWVCPRCNKKYPRSTTHYLTEDEVVEEEFERMFSQN